MGCVLGGHLVVAADAVEHRLQVFVERRRVDVGQAALGPAGADGGRGEKRVGPVHGAAAADGAPGGDGDHAVGGGEEPAAQEEVLIRDQFQLDEVGLVPVAACLQGDDPLAGLRQHSGGDPAAAAGADHDHIRLKRRLAGRGDDVKCLGRLRRGLDRARVPHPGPQGVATLRVGQAVGEHHRKLMQRRYCTRALGRDAREVGDDRLPDGLRLILQPDQAGGIEQLEQAGELRVGQVAHEVLLRGNVGAEVAALGGVKPGWVVLARNGRDEGVDDRGQGLALQSVEFEAHGGDLSWSVGCRDDAQP